MNGAGVAGARLSSDWPLAGALTYQIDGVVVLAVTTNSFGTALEIVGTATRYRDRWSAGTLVTSSHVPHGSVGEAVDAVAPTPPPTTKTRSRPGGPPTLASARADDSRALLKAGVAVGGTPLPIATASISAGSPPRLFPGVIAIV